MLAVAIGVGLTALSYALLTRQAPLSISPLFIPRRPCRSGGGTNVVNVMLVDFAASTRWARSPCWASIGLTVYAARRFRPARETVEATGQQQVSADTAGADLIDRDGDGDDHLPPYLEVPAVLVRLLPPVAGPVRLPPLHARPQRTGRRIRRRSGGGHRLHHAIHGQRDARWVEERMHLLPTRWIATGLLIALVTGLGFAGAGHPFLTTHTAHVNWPLVGDASAHGGDLRPGRVAVGGG